MMNTEDIKVLFASVTGITINLTSLDIILKVCVTGATLVYIVTRTVLAVLRYSRRDKGD